MKRTPLKRKTPLRAKTEFKPRIAPINAKAVKVHDKAGEKPTAGNETPKKAKQQTRSSLETHLDIVFSLYIRLRDAMPSGRVRCISCGRTFPFSVIQAGHFYTRHNKSVRWDEQNVNAQCPTCNCDKHGNIEAYRPALIAKIGQQQYDDLCTRAHKSRKWSGDELRDMIRHYTAEVKRISREKGIQTRI